MTVAAFIYARFDVAISIVRRTPCKALFGGLRQSQELFEKKVPCFICSSFLHFAQLKLAEPLG
jgi:hypothetical protein